MIRGEAGFVLWIGRYLWWGPGSAHNAASNLGLFCLLA